VRAAVDLSPLPTVAAHPAALTLENAGNLRELARYGDGDLDRIQWSPDGSRLWLVTDIGAYD
jgi:hypothetical protein